MSFTSKYYTAFNTTFSDFIVNLVKAYPNDKDFQVFKSGFNLVKNFDEKKPRKLFHEFVPPYEKYIKEKNDAFFIEDNAFRNYLSCHDQANITEELLEKLHKYWVDMDQENRDIVWDYLQLLLKINEKISASS